MSYPNYPYASSTTIESYISADNVLNYLHNFAQQFDLQKQIKFERNVVRVRPVESRWEVIARNVPENKHEIYSFDAVLVCTGNFHTPFRPKIVDEDLFKGVQIHSHDYRDAETFRGECVLVVGGNIFTIPFFSIQNFAQNSLLISQRVPVELTSCYKYQKQQNQ
jgi:cation diffusion facilitator CzcD-associated flavoprotein CzcO